jgi:hypothetical protein
MPRKSSPDTLIVRGLSADDQAWLASESERLGVDAENLVRAMIRQRRGLRVVPAEDETSPTTLMSAELAEADYREALSVAERLSRRPHLEADAAAMQSDGIGPDDELTLDALMAAQPSLTERPPEPQRSPWIGPQRSHNRMHPARRSQASAAAVAPRVAGAFSAFTLVKPVGLSDRVALGPTQGDGPGNVMRQNSTWLGFSNGGSRR